MEVTLDIVGDVVGEGGEGLHNHRKLSVHTTFYTGNKRSAVSFIRSISHNKIVDEVLLQVNDDGKLSIARKRDV